MVVRFANGDTLPREATLKTRNVQEAKLITEQGK